MTLSIDKKIIWEISCNIITAALYVSFLWKFCVSFYYRHDSSIFLLLCQESLVVIFLLVRSLPLKTSTNPVYWAAAMGGTWSPLLFKPYPFNPALILFVIPQFIGAGITMAGILSLNRSFGVMASNRSIRTKGLYRIVRHPLYAGYILTALSFLIQHLSPWNIGLVIFHVAMQLWRSLIEEDFLASDPDYAAYMKTTKWKMIPFVW